VIITPGGPTAAGALKKATTALPVVFSAVEWDPVKQGLAANLRRPGGNFTGVTLFAAEIAAKRLELLREAAPQTRRVAVMWHRSRAAEQFKTIQEVAPRLKIEVMSVELGEPQYDLEGAFRAAAQRGADSLILLGSPAFLQDRARFAELALRHRFPTSFQRPAYAETGGLMSFGADIDHMYTRLAHYVDRILKGGRPAEMPIEQPTKFELVINLKTAKALGLTIPPSLLARADQVIE
jgi:putative ABC transport system substrate-binding protein